MNRNRRIIDIVYKTVERNIDKFPGYKLESYDNWKDDIIGKMQNYIANNYVPKKKVKHLQEVINNYSEMFGIK